MHATAATHLSTSGGERGATLAACCDVEQLHAPTGEAGGGVRCGTRGRLAYRPQARAPSGTIDSILSPPNASATNAKPACQSHADRRDAASPQPSAPRRCSASSRAVSAVSAAGVAMPRAQLAWRAASAVSRSHATARAHAARASEIERSQSMQGMRF